MTADPFDAVLDARSEARYEDEPQAEPDTREVADNVIRNTESAWLVDESAGFRG